MEQNKYAISVAVGGRITNPHARSGWIANPAELDAGLQIQQNWKKNFNKKKEIFSISFFCSHHSVIITLYPFESIRTIYCPTESGKENESSSTLREKINFPSIVKIET